MFFLSQNVSCWCRRIIIIIFPVILWPTNTLNLDSKISFIAVLFVGLSLNVSGMTYCSTSFDKNRITSKFLWVVCNEVKTKWRNYLTVFIYFFSSTKTSASYIMYCVDLVYLVTIGANQFQTAVAFKTEFTSTSIWSNELFIVNFLSCNLLHYLHRIL